RPGPGNDQNDRRAFSGVDQGPGQGPAWTRGGDGALGRLRGRQCGNEQDHSSPPQRQRMPPLVVLAAITRKMTVAGKMIDSTDTGRLANRKALPIVTAK